MKVSVKHCSQVLCGVDGVVEAAGAVVKFSGELKYTAIAAVSPSAESYVQISTCPNVGSDPIVADPIVALDKFPRGNILKHRQWYDTHRILNWIDSARTLVQ